MGRAPAGDSAPILIVDPDQGERAASSEFLRRAGYATREADSGEHAVDIALRERPAVVVLEVRLPGISGYEVCRELREAFGESLGILFISGTRTESFDRVGGLLLGADDYLVKPIASDELVARVRGLTRRSGTLAPGFDSKLTRREHEVLQLLAQGLDQKEIANQLSISPSTVGTHTEHLFAKLEVHSRSEAVSVAYRNALLDKRCLFPILPLLDGDFLSEWLEVLGTALSYAAP
jgi:DNA-binding NarL/FixJ family response regulator